MSSTGDFPVLGILGAGKLGAVLARQARRVGYRVLVADSGDPDRLAMKLSFLAPGAEACLVGEVAAWADLIHLALPISAYRSLPVQELRGKIVIDGMNYWEGKGPGLAEFTAEPDASSLLVQAALAGTFLVKSLNHLGFHEIEEDALPAASPGRRALGLAGDDPGARAQVGRFLDRLGFDSLDLGPLVEGRRLGPSSPIFGRRLSLEALRKALGVEIA